MSRFVFYKQKLFIIKITIEMGFIFTVLFFNVKRDTLCMFCLGNSFRMLGTARALEHLEKQPWAIDLQLIYSYCKHSGTCVGGDHELVCIW